MILNVIQARVLGLPDTLEVVRACFYLGFGLLQTEQIVHDRNRWSGVIATADFLGIKESNFEVIVLDGK